MFQSATSASTPNLCGVYSFFLGRGCSCASQCSLLKQEHACYCRITREEGVAGLFRGAAPTVTRAMALNMGMLASNDQAREMLVDAGFEKGSYVVVLGGSITSGFFASACR